MLSVTNGSFLSTEILAPGSQGVFLTFIVKQFFRFLKASISRTKNVKKYFLTINCMILNACVCRAVPKFALTIRIRVLG